MQNCKFSPSHPHKFFFLIIWIISFQPVTKVELIPPKNGSEKDCIQPAVTQFPNPILDHETRKNGGVILHIIVAFYMFIGKLIPDILKF